MRPLWGLKGLHDLTTLYFSIASIHAELLEGVGYDVACF